MVIDTVYDGEDLAEVAELTGLSIDAVIAAHTGQPWTVAFAGFAPGFGYLVGDNDGLNVPRRSSPRTAVPAGSVALAGNYSAVYPRRSPGGWQLIGRTAARMWDLDREQPALAAPGRPDPVPRGPRDRVAGAGTARRQSPRRRWPPDSGSSRPGCRAWSRTSDATATPASASPRAGALDRASLRRANRLVGNAPSAAAIETVAGGLTVQAVGDQVLAVAGAPSELAITTPAGPEAEPGRRTVPMATPFALLDGETLSIGAPESGFRSYLAVRGGVDAAQILGSRSTDTMSGIGPAPLAAGQLLASGGDSESGVVGHPELQPDFPGTGVTVLDVVPGPRADWFDAEALESLIRQEWQVKAAVQPGGHAPGRNAAATHPGRGTGQRGDRCRCPAGPARRPARALPGRPPGHRRLPGDRRRRRFAAGPRRAGPDRRDHPLPLGGQQRPGARRRGLSEHLARQVTAAGPPRGPRPLFGARTYT